jgi:hypothetical protein
MTRRPIAILAIVGIAALIALDLNASPANPYAAPPAIALGSGVASAGGFCGQLPQ